jgi:short-subunit dehydrogenase
MSTTQYKTRISFTDTRARLRAWRQRQLTAALTGAGPMRARPIDLEAVSAQLAGRTVLITGASSGIGHALAIKLADVGAETILVARSGTKLQALRQQIQARGARTRVYVADLSSAESSEALLAELARDGVTVDVLVNNAGRSIRRAIDQAYDRLHDYERTMAINYFGSLRLTLGLLPGMRARRRGHVLNVSSAGVQVSSPLFSAYVASKAALDAFARVAATETRGDGVRFSVVHLPLVRTPMTAPTQAYEATAMLSAEQAADVLLSAMLTRQPQLGTWTGGLMQLMYVVAPGLVERWMADAQQCLTLDGGGRGVPEKFARSIEPRGRLEEACAAE